MHIPDGFLDAKTWVGLDIVSFGALVMAIRKTRHHLGERQIPLMGVMAAFIFAAQMINFPVAGGTSGHFMGGFLAAMLLGPLTAVPIMAVVLIVQCLVFQDGGLTALGANIFNMGVIGSMAGYYLYRGISRFSSNSRFQSFSIFIAAWFSIVLSAGMCALELGASGIVPVRIALPAMTGIHAIIGIGEGIITVLVLSFVAKIRPDLLDIQKA